MGKTEWSQKKWVWKLEIKIKVKSASDTKQKKNEMQFIIELEIWGGEKRFKE